MSWMVIGVLIIVGLIFLVLEVLVIPGTSVAGFVGFFAIGIGIWQAFAQYGTTVGVWTLVATMLVTSIIMYYALKSNTWKRLMLKDKNDAQVNVIEEGKVNPGDSAITVSRLAPSGTVEIDGEFYEAHTYGEFVDPGMNVTVLKVENGKVFVKFNS